MISLVIPPGDQVRSLLQFRLNPNPRRASGQAAVVDDDVDVDVDVVVVVVVVVLTFTRIIKSVLTGQTPVTLKWENTQGEQKSKSKVVHVCIIADASRTSTQKNKNGYENQRTCVSGP